MANFKIVQHRLPAAHIRGYPQSVLHSQETALELEVKQYIPLSNQSPRPGDVTIIGAHANGFPKELYEPLWDELLKRSEAAGFRIRGIWVADAAWQGQSYVANENKLGIHWTWDDHSRDLLNLVNHFRADMPRPLMGIGHSMGGHQIALLSLMHPRLFESIVLIDPIIANGGGSPKFNPGVISARRRDLWPSRQAAAEAFGKSRFYQAWDARVLDLWIEYGLRQLPTRAYPAHSQEVTLTTPRLSEVMSFGKDVLSPEPQPASGFSADEWALLRAQHDPDQPRDLPYTPGPSIRPEILLLYPQLPFLRPSVLWLLGAHSQSPMNQRDVAEERARHTGSGIGGSGGVANGRVRTVYVQGAGHLVPMEQVSASADEIAAWLGQEMQRYQQKEDVYQRYWQSIPDKDKHTLSDAFLQACRDLAKL